MRGLNNRARRDSVWRVVEAFHPTVVCLQETKLSHITGWDVMSILGREFQHFSFLPAQGTRGEILVAWRMGVFSSDHWIMHRIQFQ
jgi:exonuclease III